jgi:hypothetical protein
VAPPADAPASAQPATLTPAPVAAAPAAAAAPAPAAPTVLNTRSSAGFADTETGSGRPWRGSAISYGAFASAMTFAPTGQPWYDPTVGQNITLLPEWHFNDRFFTRARMFISQELTASDTTTTLHEVELSDIYWDWGTTGWKEPHTGVQIAGDVRFVLPTSKLSHLKTQLLTVGPGVSVSRKFNVLSGLAIGYGVRPTVHFNQWTTGESYQHNLVTCNDPQSSDCQFDMNTGGRNVYFDVGHGPFLSFQPYSTVSLDMAFIMTRGWLYAPAGAPVGQDGKPIMVSPGALSDNGTTVKDITRFLVSVSWQFTKPVGVALTALTYGGQLAYDGTYIFPLFNRNTTLYLDFTLDIENVTSRLF